MILTKKEIEAVIQLNAFDRYKYFIKRVADDETMYTLVDEGKRFAIVEVDNKKLFSLWSASEFAVMSKVHEWQNFTVLKITLEKFKDEVIDLIEENEWLINVFSVNGKTGFVVDIDEFAKDLSEELKRYN